LLANKHKRYDASNAYLSELENGQICRGVICDLSMLASAVVSVVIDRQWVRYEKVALSPLECGIYAESRLAEIAKHQEAGTLALESSNRVVAQAHFGEAVRLLRRQINDCNSPQAKLHMSFAYCIGLGVERNQDLAKRFFSEVPLEVGQAEELYREGVYECKS
jgi:hypothetical protein